MADDDPLLTTTEAADIVGVHVETIRRWIRLGKLEGECLSPFGRLLRVRRSSVFALRRTFHVESARHRTTQRNSPLHT